MYDIRRVGDIHSVFTTTVSEVMVVGPAFCAQFFFTVGPRVNRPSVSFCFFLFVRVLIYFSLGFCFFLLPFLLPLCVVLVTFYTRLRRAEKSFATAGAVKVYDLHLGYLRLRYGGTHKFRNKLSTVLLNNVEKLRAMD